ncbi:LOW QUALITY PROTEIN: atrial natriuretic peptide receptor 1-like [Haliotis rubra]|uniref:LOW QUALITY PROTEIN: atrial natriuretic peptide receptor 1-like n=1 Tax=Haliotis rubra TaxID=36100 RepID=UPI001EE57A44|nr:LOW QUALITY PROTEIN: atrial natriuretic peptide receptor 1-like [Haliotis rubra]
MQMACFLLRLELLLLGSCQAREFRLGMLSPFRHVRLGWENNAAAATLAIERAQAEGLLPGHNITVRWRDDDCSALKGSGNTVLLRDEDDVDVFIGPPCSSFVILCTENTADRRTILIHAAREGMMDGTYVFFLPEHLPPPNVQTPWVKGDELDEEAKAAFTSVFQITVSELAGAEVQAFRDLVSVKMAEAPWYYNYTLLNGIKGSDYSPFLHDVVYLYLLVLHEAVTEGADHRNGTLIFNKAKGKSFHGITGTVQVDNNGDREPDYWVWDLQPGGQQFRVAMEARLTTTDDQKINVIQDIVWGTSNGKPPTDAPACGFFEELCRQEDGSGRDIIITVSVLVVSVIIVAVIVAVIILRRSSLERELQQRLWVIPYDDITFSKTRLLGSISTISINTNTSSQKLETGGIGEGQIFSTIGHYKGNTMAIRKIEYPINVSTMSRQDMLELKAMKDLRHENVNAFIGLCHDDRFPCWLTLYCSKGSLQDIIGNEDIKLERMFKMSLITDLVNGLCYIHSSPLRDHGNLKSSNCVVDNRWVLKVTDFGMKHLRRPSDKINAEYQLLQGLFWTAPEVLRSKDVMAPAQLQKADVYSFGIIMYEILQRCQPYDTDRSTPKEIIENLRAPRNPIFRPDTDKNQQSESQTSGDNVPESAMVLMKNCWEEVPDSRPTFTSIKQSLLTLNKGRKLNIVDNMILMLEKYANNLEEIIEQRTSDLVEEKKKSDTLLFRMLPVSIAEKLKRGSKVKAEIFESVTVYFSDIVGFTDLAARSTPIQVVDLLNDLYTMFDLNISHHNVYKVETIGDAYMVVSGLPDRNGNRHVSEIANMALDLLQSIGNFKVAHCPDYQMKLRIGLHTGSCAAGVVGKTMPRYCLFGDTVNMASRMESNGEALKIHMSEVTASFLQELEGYIVSRRGEIEIKGKGRQTTYWLCARNKH